MVDPVLTDVLDIIPEHVVDPIRRPSWPRRWVAGGRDALLSLLLNGAVVLAMIGVGFPLRAQKSPEAISVELVPHMPGSQAGGGAPGRTEADSGRAAPAPEKVAENAASPAPAAEEPKRPPSEPPVAPALPPEPKPVPPQAPMPEAADQAQATPPPITPAEEHPPEAQAAVPPPPEHPDADARPHLVEAPSAPPTNQPDPQAQPAAGSSEPAQQAAEAPAAASPAPVETALPAQRPLQSASEGEEAVPPPSPPPEAPKPLTAEERRQAANTATLAAMLPFGGGISGNPFTAQSPVAGQGTSTAYRGQVYANFNKAQDIIADAKARNLKGQAVVAFTIDDHGNLASIGIAVSSKNPEVDQAALELIRRAAPFPPPPPGAQRSFAPAIRLGLDD